MPEIEQEIYLVAATADADQKIRRSVARITTTLLHALRTHHKKLGLATLGSSGGMGLSMIVERV